MAKKKFKNSPYFFWGQNSDKKFQTKITKWRFCDMNGTGPLHSQIQYLKIQKFLEYNVKGHPMLSG